jgi:hypothetical protein
MITTATSAPSDALPRHNSIIISLNRLFDKIGTNSEAAKKIRKSSEIPEAYSFHRHVIPGGARRSGHQTGKNQVDVAIQECFVDRCA